MNTEQKDESVSRDDLREELLDLIDEYSVWCDDLYGDADTAKELWQSIHDFLDKHF